MRRFRHLGIALSTALAALALAVQAGEAATAQKPGWVRWEGRSFICWLPSRDWRVAESMSGIDISSPTGDLYVGFAFATNSPAPVTTEQVIQYVYSNGGLDIHPVSGVRVLKTGRPFAFAGGTRQIVEWTGVRQHRLKGRQTVHGVLTVDVFSDPSIGAYGFGSYARVAPVSQWKKQAATLKTIQDRITFLGRG